MEVDFEREVLHAVRDGLAKVVTDKIGGYNSPIAPLLNEAIESQKSAIQKLLLESLQSAIGDEPFREEIRVAVRRKLARTLIERFGGELETQVNKLKSDPTTRARITLAIEEIVKA